MRLVRGVHLSFCVQHSSLEKLLHHWRAADLNGNDGGGDNRRIRCGRIDRAVSSHRDRQAADALGSAEERDSTVHQLEKRWFEARRERLGLELERTQAIARPTGTTGGCGGRRRSGRWLSRSRLKHCSHVRMEALSKRSGRRSRCPPRVRRSSPGLLRCPRQKARQRFPQSGRFTSLVNVCK